MKNFNWVGLLCAVVLSAGWSLLLSLEDAKLETIELVRAVIQTVIAAFAFVANPVMPSAPPAAGNAITKRRSKDEN